MALLIFLGVQENCRTPQDTIGRLQDTYLSRSLIVSLATEEFENGSGVKECTDIDHKSDSCGFEHPGNVTPPSDIRTPGI